MTERLMIVSDDASYAEWLRNHIETLRPYCSIETLSGVAFAARAAPPTIHDADMLLLHAEFPAALDGVRELAARPDAPVILTIANGGNELTAVKALRYGAADYLPRALLTPALLAEALHSAADLALHRAAEHRRNNAAEGSGEATIEIPRYDILRTIGRSERATVYLASSAAQERTVALKVSHPVDSENPGYFQELAREYEALAAIDHPSIVDIYDYGMHRGREYLAMEYFPNGDLKQRMEKPLSIAQTLAYAQRIATALEVIHRHGIVHRDLKPPNVMLRDNDEIVLIDFGLAKPTDVTASHSGMLRGSPYFMSPEQAQGHPVDGRSDLYSLGVILYEMLTGRKPFYGESAIELLQQHVTAPVPPLPPQLAMFQPIIDRLLAKSPADRYASAAEVDAALRVA
ncbi:MAG: protein kinase [Steroidobacteraceae bacterium]|nr:protein kinase [Steroidobacteraceae bacterium]MDW8258404.1 protein kinase [Gammaproteobacteria bacterium]